MLIDINGVKYHIEIHGEGEPVLFLHGFTGNINNWLELKPFIDGSYKFIFVDIIGHGKTDSPQDEERYQIESVAKDIISILDTLGIPEFHLLGYSMGGRLALSIACNYPSRVKSLILESSSPGLKTEGEKSTRIAADRNLANKILNEGILDFVTHWENIPLFKSQKRLSITQQRAIRVQRLRNDPIGLSNSLKGMGTGVQPSYWSALSELTQPTLLVCGELDNKFCMIAEEMANLLNNVHVEKIKGAGHAIHVEQARNFGKIVSVFLKEQATQIL